MALNEPFLKLHRNLQPFNSYQEAKDAIVATSSTRSDGEPFIATYKDDNNDIHTILAIKRDFEGETQLEYIEGASSIIDSLDSTVGDTTVSEGKHVAVQVVEENGKLTSITITEDDIASASLLGTKTDASDADTAFGRIKSINDTIDAMDKSASAVDGQVVTTVSEANGIVSETKANVKDLQLGGYTYDTTATGAIGSTDTINTALSKLEHNVSSNQITNSDGSITVTPQETSTDVKVNIKSGEQVIKLDDASNGIYTNITISTISTDLPANVGARYALKSGDTQLGSYIDIPKDSSLINVVLGHVDDTLQNEDPTTHESDSSTIVDGTGDAALVFVNQLSNGKYKLTAVNVESFLEETEFKDGLDVASHEVKVKIDSTSEGYLTVGTNGVKLSGVDTAISNAIGALDATDAAVDSQYVSSVSETNGVVSVTRTDVSGAKLNNYTKGTDEGAIVSSDTINQAFSKIENTISNNEQVTSEALNDLDSRKANASDVLNGVEAGNGIEVGAKDSEGKQSVAVKIDSTSENYLTVGTDGVKLSGVDNKISGAITDAIGTLDVTDAAVDSKYVSSVSESDGKISVSRTDVSGAKLNNYAKGTDATPIASTDTINQAFSKVENIIEENELVISEALNDLNSRKADYDVWDCGEY